MMRGVTPSTSKSYAITDELAGVVDVAVARLCERYAQIGESVWLNYGAKWPAKKIADKNSMSEVSARQLIKTGVGWIDCALEQIREAA